MIDKLMVLSILIGVLSFLVGFLMLFLEFYPQRKRYFIQALTIELIHVIDNEPLKKELKKIIEKAEKPDYIVIKIDVNKLNFSVFIFSVLIFLFSLSLVTFYVFYDTISNMALYVLLIFTIVGYILLILVVKYSYLKTRYILPDKEESEE